MSASSKKNLTKKNISSSWENIVVVISIILCCFTIVVVCVSRYSSVESIVNSVRSSNLYVSLHDRMISSNADVAFSIQNVAEENKLIEVPEVAVYPTSDSAVSGSSSSKDILRKMKNDMSGSTKMQPVETVKINNVKTESKVSLSQQVSPQFRQYASIPIVPVLGPFTRNGSKPLYGMKHNEGNDVVFALACKYPKNYFERFVGSLRKFGYPGDIVLAVSPPDQMKPGVGEYLQKMNVAAYAFDVNCNGKDSCQFKDEFLGYPDPRPFRTFANIRYALYEYWMRYYNEQSYILILDFRDTFFQGDPFASFGYPVSNRIPKYDLQVYAENYKVKNIGICKFNSLWVGRCFGKEHLQALKHLPVICSGSTLGSYPAIRNYVAIMLRSMDEVQCWRKGIESDQGYQNYLFHNGLFNTKEGNATMNLQGNGVVNTIGALNGRRVPADQKGPLDTFWKMRDGAGFVLNNDKTRSACVHQWDRFHDELAPFIDTKVYD